MSNNKTQGDPFASSPGQSAGAGSTEGAARGTVLKASSGARYRVLETKSGGMGVVYLCTVSGEESSDPEIALKTYHKSRMFNLASQNAFRDEVTIWMRLSHLPYILPALGLETIEGQYYVVMLPVQPGPNGVVSVADLLRLQGKGLPAEETFRYFFQMVMALVLAHKEVPGLVHGDIKPSNLLLIHGNAFISDFGLAQAEQKGQAQRRKLTGTFAYSAPELWRADVHASVKTDIYSMGVTLYEMLTNCLPFNASTSESWQKVHSQTERKLPKGFLTGGMAGELMQLALRCMAADPEQRPQEMVDLNRLTAAIGDRNNRELVARILMEAAWLSSSRTEVEGDLSLKHRLRAMLELGQIEELLKEFESIDSDVFSDDLKIIKGTALSLAERPEESLACFEEILSHDPQDDIRRHCYSEIALNLKRLKRFDEAEKIYKDLLPVTPDDEYPKIATNLATVYLEGNKPEDARKLLQSVVMEHPNVAAIWTNLGQAQSATGQHEQAVKSFQRALNLDASLSIARLSLAAELMDHFGMFREALAALDLVYEQGYHSPEWWKRTWVVNMILGNMRDASGLLDNLGQQGGEEKFKDDMVKEAVAMLGRFIKPDGSLQELTPDRQKSPESFPTTTPTSEPSWQEKRGIGKNLAHLFKSLGRSRKSATAQPPGSDFSLPFVNTKVYFPSNTVAVDFYGDLSSETYLDELVESWRTVKRNIVHQISNASMRSMPLYFAQCSACNQILLTNREQGESLNCRACGKKRPVARLDRPDLARTLSQANERLGLTLMNVSSYVAYLAIWPNDDAQLEQIKNICAEKMLEPIEPGDQATNFLKYLALRRNLQVEPESRCLAWKIPLDSDQPGYAGKSDPSVERLIRELRERTGDFQSADLMVDLKADDFLTLTVTGRVNEVEARLRESLLMHPDDPVARQTLIGHLLSQNRLDDATEESERLLALYPFDPFTLKLAGIVESKHERYQKAAQYLEKSIELDPTDVSARFQLVFCYQQMGEQEKADDQMARARATGSPF